MAKYKLKGGTFSIKGKRYMPGDMVELTDERYKKFADMFEKPQAPKTNAQPSKPVEAHKPAEAPKANK